MLRAEFSAPHLQHLTEKRMGGRDVTVAGECLGKGARHGRPRQAPLAVMDTSQIEFRGQDIPRLV